MPVKKCSADGKSGWKFGDGGHCYTGPGAKLKAIKQGLAILGPEKFKKEMSKANINIDTDDIAEVANASADTIDDVDAINVLYSLGYTLEEILFLHVQAAVSKQTKKE